MKSIMDIFLRTILVFTTLLAASFFVPVRSQQLVLIPNPPGYTISTAGPFGSPIEYNGKLYYRFQNDAEIHELMEFDGSNYTLIPTPPGHSDPDRGYTGEPYVYNGDLYMKYRNNAGNYQMYKFDGSTLSLVPNPPD